MPGENATVSGGVPLKPLWKQWKTRAGKQLPVWAADLSALQLDDVPSLRLDGQRVAARGEPTTWQYKRVLEYLSRYGIR